MDIYILAKFHNFMLFCFELRDLEEEEEEEKNDDEQNSLS